MAQETNKGMSREDILSTFNELAKSQGFYGRLLRSIQEDPECGDAFLTELENKNFKDAVDLVIYVES